MNIVAGVVELFKIDNLSLRCFVQTAILEYPHKSHLRFSTDYVPIQRPFVI